VSAALRFDGVGVRLGERWALRGVTIESDARRIAVIGANGSGKSTFARLLNGLVTATEGTAVVHGVDPARDKRAARRAVGFVFSNPDAQIIMPTVEEDLAFSLRGRGLSSAEVAERVGAALDRFGLRHLAAERCFELSSGQKQLLAVAAVLIASPSLVVADEPTALLDAENSRLIRRHLIDELTQQLVLVTHDLALADRCDVAVRFAGGRLVDSGPASEVVERYRIEVA
jgi:biotin transport system ATP-binding protein